MATDNLRDQFSGSCINVCDSGAVLPSDVQMNCDSGSQNYCSKNISDSKCNPYITRIDTTVSANINNTIYNNKVVPITGSTVNSYYDTLLDSIITYCNDPTNINGAQCASLINSLTSTYPKLVTNLNTKIYPTAINYCLKNPKDTTFCLSTGPNFNGIPAWIKSMVTMAATTYNVINDIKSLNTPVMFYQDPIYIPLYKLYPSLFTNGKTGIEDIAVNYCSSTTGMSDPNILMAYLVSPLVSAAIDDKVITYMSNSDNFYSNIGLALYANINSFDAANYKNLDSTTANTTFKNSKLVTTIKNKFTSDSNNCKNDPFSADCNNIKLLNGPEFVTNLVKVQDTYCSSNIFDPNCNVYYQHLPATSMIKLDDVQNTAITYCTSAAGQADTKNCSPYPNVPGAKTWLQNNTSNTITKDVNGNVTGITTQCGSTGKPTIATCVSLCKQYPDICVGDQEAKCSLGQYRYSTDANTFTNKENLENKESLTNINHSSKYSWIISILFILFIILCICSGANPFLLLFMINSN